MSEPENFVTKSRYLRQRAKDEEAGEDFVDLICFSLLGETFGIELIHLQEILKSTGILYVPKSPRHLRGILNLRGSFITVLDLKRRLGMPDAESTWDSRVMIVEFDDRPIGLLVDKVQEIIRLENEKISDPPSGFPEEKKKYIKGIGKAEDRIIVFPDLAKILAKPKE